MQAVKQTWLSTWNLENARIGTTREVAVELVVNGLAVTRRRWSPTGRLDRSVSGLSLPAALGWPYGYSPRLTRLPSFRRWTKNQSVLQSAARGGVAPVSIGSGRSSHLSCATPSALRQRAPMITLVKRMSASSMNVKSNDAPSSRCVRYFHSARTHMRGRLRTHARPPYDGGRLGQ